MVSCFYQSEIIKQSIKFVHMKIKVSLPYNCISVLDLNHVSAYMYVGYRGYRFSSSYKWRCQPYMTLNYWNFNKKNHFENWTKLKWNQMECTTFQIREESSWLVNPVESSDVTDIKNSRIKKNLLFWSQLKIMWLSICKIIS